MFNIVTNTMIILTFICGPKYLYLFHLVITYFYKSLFKIVLNIFRSLFFIKILDMLSVSPNLHYFAT
jgi:hypothetical protein